MELIDRQAAIEAFQMFRKYESNRSNSEWVDRIETVLKAQPTIGTDISEYSDRLWKTAYERGKNEGIVQCKYCKWSRCHINVDKQGETETYWRCMNWDGETDEEGYCHEWKRRTDD